MYRMPDAPDYAGMVGPLARRWARGGVPAVSVLLAGVLLAGIVLAARGPDPAGADTVLLRGAGTTVELAGGGTRAIAAGEVVPRGAVVHPGAQGAVLRVLGRDTWLSVAAAVQVLDGARQQLRQGLVMVDARRGPTLEVGTASASVTAPRGSVSRVESGPVLRVGTYAGDPVLVRPAGLRATASVARDYQVQVPENSRPGRPTPLVLTPGDAAERALAPALVDADEALTGYARQLDDAGTAGRAVQAAAARDLPGAPSCGASGSPAGERALAFVLAAAQPGDQFPARYARTCELRADGGSWGVVADLVGTTVADVGALLEALLRPTSLAAGPPPAAAGAAAAALGAAPLTGAPATGPPAPSPPVVLASPPGGAPGRPPQPAPSPTTPALLDAVVGAVLSLLPVPLPTGSPGGSGSAAAPGGPQPTPTPAVSAGLLGGLLAR